MVLITERGGLRRSQSALRSGRKDNQWKVDDLRTDAQEAFVPVAGRVSPRSGDYITQIDGVMFIQERQAYSMLDS